MGYIASLWFILSENQNKVIKQYRKKFPLITNSIFHLRPENVSYNTRLSGNEGQCFLYECRKFQKTGLLMTADDSGDHLVKPLVYPDYTF